MGQGLQRAINAARATTFRVETQLGTVLFKTDDWVAAQDFAIRRSGRGELAYVRGTHPSHDWDDQRLRRCRKCEGWDNGSYGSQSPCGYDWTGPGGSSLVAAVERELAKRATENGA